MHRGGCLHDNYSSTLSPEAGREAGEGGGRQGGREGGSRQGVVDHVEWVREVRNGQCGRANM